MNSTSPPSPRYACRERGSALIAILWVVAILSIAVFSATQFLFIELESESNSSSLFRAEQLADRGVAIASHPDIKRGDPLLVRQFSEAEAYQARVSSEGSRLNLNTLLENAEEDRIVLEELFVRWGLRFDEAQDVVDNLIDWIDEDDEPTNLGAEQPFYLARERPNHPFNRPFEFLEEAELVAQFDRILAIKPDWKDSFTLLSSGELDLNEAPVELIAVACECGTVAAEAFVEIRNELADNPTGELPFADVDSALEILGIPADSADRIVNRLSVEDPARRVISVGRFGPIAVERIVTVQYTGASGEILQWKTRRIQ